PFAVRPAVMKFSLGWLGDHVTLPDAGAPDSVRRLLDRAGLPVESVEEAHGVVVFDVEITPNRPDAMNHRGLAREIAAMSGAAFPNASGKSVGELPSEGPPAHELSSVESQVPGLCRRFGARVARGGVVGRRRDPADVAAARNAHRRLPPFRARRGSGVDPGGARPGREPAAGGGRRHPRPGADRRAWTSVRAPPRRPAPHAAATALGRRPPRSRLRGGGALEA